MECTNRTCLRRHVLHCSAWRARDWNLDSQAAQCSCTSTRENKSWGMSVLVSWHWIRELVGYRYCCNAWIIHFIDAGRNLVSHTASSTHLCTAGPHTILSSGLPPPPATGAARCGHLPQGADADTAGEQGTHGSVSDNADPSKSDSENGVLDLCGVLSWKVEIFRVLDVEGNCSV